MDLSAYADLAVRLVNTEPGRPSEPDPLANLAGLRALLADQRTWRHRAQAADLAGFRRLRAGLRPVFVAADQARYEEAVRRANGLLDEVTIRPQITGHDGEPLHLHLHERAPTVAEAYAAAAMFGVAVVITEHGVDRLGVCQARPCTRVFVDTSTNRSRRYCSDRCATRANVAAFRARRRGAGMVPAGHSQRGAGQ
ncbi:MAG: CGNR zinc finger domain-containing protein [Actinomycetes bacterium]